MEKTGCDAAMLSAPSQLHGSEVGLLGEATLQSDPSIHLSFACEELLVCCTPSALGSTLMAPLIFQERQEAAHILSMSDEAVHLL